MSVIWKFGVNVLEKNAAIMSNIEGWKRPEGKMRFSIYGVVKGYVREEE